MSKKDLANCIKKHLWSGEVDLEGWIFTTAPVECNECLYLEQCEEKYHFEYVEVQRN